MPHGMDVGLGPGEFVRWGPCSPLPKKRVEPPNFWPISIVANPLDASR